MPASAKWSFTFIWLFFSSAIITAAYETYDDTDRQAEESALYDDEEQEETTTFANFFIENKAIQSINKLVEVSTVPQEDVSKLEHEDPLQKILPKVKFNCKGKSEGYYADTDFCELFHYCKTNGFRFTFICPPESNYNDNLMVCEYNSTMNSRACKQRTGEQNNSTEDIDTSAGEKVEVYEQMNSDKWKPLSTSTVSYTTPPADPYLTRLRTPFGSRIKQEESALNNKSLPFNERINKDNISGLSLNTDNNMQSNNNTLLPFKGFAKSNRWKNNRNNQTDQNSNGLIKSEHDLKIAVQSNGNLINTSVKTSSSVWPLISPVGKGFQKNLSLFNDLRSSTSKTSTTTALPTLITPPTKGATTVSYSTTSSSLGSQNPSLNDRNPNQANIKNSTPDRKSPYQPQIHNRAHSQPIRFSQLLSETPQRQPIHFGLPRSQTETKFSSSTEFPYIPRDVISQDFLGYNFFSRQPLFGNLFEDQQRRDSNNLKSSALNTPNTSNSRLLTSASSPIKAKQSVPSLSQMIETLTRLHNQQMKAENSEMSVQRVTAPVELKAGNKSLGKNFGRSDQMLSIPLLVPKGLSKSDLEQSISESLLKPITIPLTKNGQKIPAYVLHLQNSQESHKTKQKKTRPKRQTFGFGTPYLESPFISNNQYLPMLSSVPDNNFINYISNGLPSFDDQSHIGIGEKPSLRLNPSAQQNMPYYMPGRQYNVNRPPNFDQNIFDLSEFSDFPVMQNMPFNRNPLPLIQNQPNDLAQYRAVSLRRPSFRRPPRRDKIPQNSSANNQKSSSTKSQKTPENDVEKVIQTTGSPLSSDPNFSSVRPYSPQITKHPQFLDNTNPFSQISDTNFGNIGDAIKLFDSSDDHFRPINPSVFNSQSLFRLNSPKSQSNLIETKNNPENGQPIASDLTGRPSRNNVYSGEQINTYSPQNNYLLQQQFPPIPEFGDPDFRLPYIHIQDPTLRNVVYPQRNNRQYQPYLGAQHYRAQVNSTSINGDTIQNFYQPEIFNDFKRDNQQNKSEKNPNHNYDKDVLQTARTHGIIRKLEPIHDSRSNWNSILGRINSPNITITKTVSYSTKVEDDKNSQNDGSDKENSANQRPLSYGTRLKANENNNLTISVKSSVRSVSSLLPEPSNQIVISKKSGAVLDQLNNDKNNDEINNSKVNWNSDRLTLLKFFNDLNAQKKYDTTTTTTMSPTTIKPPSTTHWSIRGWMDSKYTSQTSTTTSPTTTVNQDFQIFDLFESEASRVESTTQPPQTTTPRTESAYRKVFNSFQYNKKPQLFSLKARPDLSLYISSITTTPKSI